MAYVEMLSIPSAAGSRLTSGTQAIQLADRAYAGGRHEEARGLIELAYRLFDEQAERLGTPAIRRRDRCPA